MSEKKLMGILWTLNTIMVVVFLFPLGDLASIFQFVGRLHPLILHFPIVLLIAGFLFEIIDSRRNKKDYGSAASLLLWAGAFTAVISAIAGMLLSANGEYSGDTFLFHKWFGLATSVIAGLLVSFKAKLATKRAFIPIYALLMFLLVVTGHFGASLTHGEGFLTDVFQKDQQLPLEAESPVFTQIVAPILDSKCTSCHNPNKLKGGLLLDSQEGILKGGESGDVLVPGDIQKSLLTHNVLLPTEADDHMPPDGKLQLSNAEVEILIWWVENGASFSQKLEDVESDDPVRAVLAEYFKPAEKLNVDFVNPEVIESLNSELVKIDQVSDDLPYLNVYIGHHKQLAANDIKSLNKVKKQIYSLDLGNSRIDKDIIKAVSKFKNLSRLYLDNTEVNDAMLSSLGKLKSLEYLNLYGTEVTKAGVSKVLKLPGLKQLYVWQTQIDESELLALKQANPTVQIDGGLSKDSEFTRAQLTSPKPEFESFFFEDRMTVNVSYGLSETQLIYQLDDELPQPIVNGSIVIDRSAKLTLIAKKEGWEDSEPTIQTFIKVANNQIGRAVLKNGPNGSYKANGVNTLLDLKKGTDNFRDGQWLGFNGDDLILDIELGEEKSISSVYVSTMEDLGSWIFPAQQIEVWGGESSEELIKLDELSFDKPEGPEPKHLKIHQLKFSPKTIRHLQVRAKNYGVLPEWHPGKGNPSWLFVDEVAFQ